MLTLVSRLILVLMVMQLAGNAGAASYQRTDGTIVDPILDRPNLEGVVEAFYSGPNLEPGAQLAGISMYGVDLESVDLRGAVLDSSYLEFTSFLFGDLRGASFVNSNLSGSIFAYSNLSEANLDGTNLADANFFGADLSGTSLVGADFFCCNNTNSRAAYASFRGADFRGANLTGARFAPNDDVTNADFSGAVLAGAIGLGVVHGAAYYDANTNFDGAWADFSIGEGDFSPIVPFDPVVAGWILLPIPEPSSALLITLGLISLSSQTASSRRRSTPRIH